ncbi:hypothetical protein KI387_028863 [Taxus chinensis]|uniref:KAP NTPase domain-containing protein n=1 Tax=Taxus chinensis TaxID=29808 RepID=A0AA38CDP8_TAXCH|nr:hypothetical protein KI387_028863 [Taxus chinensis]
MEFRTVPRRCRTEDGWRLATVEEAQQNIESIKDLLPEWQWERGRLLDGWIGGSAYNFQATVGFRSCLGHMIVVKSATTTLSCENGGSDERRKGVYSKVKLSERGRSAALFLCCEDWNYDVVCWLLNCWLQREMIVSLINDEIVTAASESVSDLARDLTSTLMKTTITEQQCSHTCVTAIVKSVEEKVRGMSVFSQLGDIYDELHLTEDLGGFEFGLDSTPEAIADTLWYFAADAIAVTTVRNFALIKEKSIHGTSLTRQDEMMEDRALIASLFAWANQFLNENYNAPVWGGVSEGFKLSPEILRLQGHGTLSYKAGSYGVLNTVILRAAKEGDLALVKRLIKCGVQPIQTDDDRGKTALHHAAKLDNESNGVAIAETLFSGVTASEEQLANAVDYKGRTPLHRAASCGHASMCELLINHKASVCSTDKRGQIPLHYAIGREQQNEKVIRVLIQADIGGKTVDTVECMNQMTPLDLAVECRSNNVRMVTWLLSLSSRPEVYFEKLDHLAPYLRHSSRMGYSFLVTELLKKGANPLDRDGEEKTAFHYAVEGKDEEVAKEIIGHLGEENLARAFDKYGRSVLHVAAFVGHRTLCEWFISLDGLDVDNKDRDGHSALYYAVAGDHDKDEVLDALIFTSSSTQGVNKVILKDSSGITPLHIAAAKGNIKMVDKLLSKRLIPKPQDRERFVRSADVLGQTALHKAASGGHKKVVKKLLKEGAHPLKERDCDGKTALHYAVQAEDNDDAMTIAKLLLKKCDCPEEKALLLFASAVGIGSAENSSTSNSSLKIYLAGQRESATNRKLNLLQEAASLGNIDMTRELLSRGGNIAHIRCLKWKAGLPVEKQNNVQDVLKQIDNIVEQGTDQPTLSDNLGRSAYANGLAALFLNPFVKSPIAVGISGEWGMGKSSLMMQTEFILLKTAAQLPFSDSLQVENFPGASKSQLTAEGRAKLENTKRLIRQLSATKSTMNDAEEKNPLSDMLSNYQPKYHQVFKSLAVMDRREMFENHENKEESRSGGMQVSSERDSIGDGQMPGSSIPSILTVRYNAWQYRNESEAWAGLAVEITKELEETMTVAEKLRTSWRYNWENHKRSICLGVFLPCFLAVLLALWLTTIVWLVLDQVNIQNARDFKYGSLPATIIVVVWAIMKSVMSVVKPISSQMVDYICLPDHSEKLGYHQKVIKDIKFLKNELGHRVCWLWKIFAFMWCCITFSWDENYVPGTWIPKMTPASEDNLRMVVFVDDLDRCQENVILQILSAINLVLAACEINVVLGMDKRMIERAIIRMFGDKNNKPNKSSQDLADKYLRKIIQLPLDLPDPSPSESKFFLEGQLGMSETRKGASGSQTETQTQTVGAHRKLDPKFRRVTSDERDSKRGIKETTTSVEETGPKKSKDCSSATDRGGLNPQSQLERNLTTDSIDLDTEIKEEKDHISVTAGDTHLSTEKEHKDTIVESGDPIASNETYANLIAAYVKKRMSSLWSKQASSYIKKLMSSLWSKQAENTEIVQQLMEMSPITHEMIIPKYSEGERDAFYFLQTYTTGSRKLPREWKRLLTYHRLAWNILSKSQLVKKLVGWQVQLIAWVFVCWQWKNLINTIIQDWHELSVLKNWMAVHDDQQEEMVHEKTSGPSLREIVEHYIDDRWPKVKNCSSLSVCEQVNLAKSREQNICTGQEKPINGILREKSIRRSASTSTCTSKEEDLKEPVVREVWKEEMEQKRGYSPTQKELQGGMKKKGKQKRKQHQFDDGLKKMMKEVLQDEEVENWVKMVMRNVLKEEKEQANRRKGRKEDKRDGVDHDPWKKDMASKKGKRKIEMEEEEEKALLQEGVF